MHKFLKRLILFSFIPLVLLSIAYFFTDPFKILRSYPTYSLPVVPVNRDHVSTEMFLRNYKKLHYNSFILGSSRTMAIKPMHWKKYMDKNAVPYMFDASMEDVYGIYTKLAFMDSLKVPIKNAIILFCNDCSFPGLPDRDGHLYIKNYKVTHENKFKYHFEFFKSYFNTRFIFCWYYYKATKKYKNWMKGYIENRNMFFDDRTNEMKILEQDWELKNNPERYYNSKSNLFYKRKGQKIDTVCKISSQDIVYLLKIKQIFRKHNTKYRIVISPLYDQIKYNKTDYLKLRNIFEPNLYDFSGDNNFTKSRCNYFEAIHFRTHVGDSILSILYK